MKHLLLTTAIALGLVSTFTSAQSYTPDPNAKEGGDLIVTYKDDVATLDPAIGYDWQNWSMIKSLFDRMMDYVPGTTKLRLGLAKDYTISEDAKTYTFHLRTGVKFTNGREMTAEDVAYSLNRVVNPKTQSPGAGYYSSIVGYEDVANGKTTELAGITVVGPDTVQIKLSHPDATFLHVMALNFSSVVPKEAVEKWGSDFGKHPVGTGAFTLKKWTLGQELVFEKNPNYWRQGIPYLNDITFEIGQEPIVALLRLQKGQVDVPGDGIPPAKFEEVMNNPEEKSHVIVGNQLQTGYVTMNVTIPPFDKVDVRKAINMAIDKKRIVQMINNRAVPANQPLPPSMPGYDKDYKGYPYDPIAAKKLLANAGYPNGFTTQMYVMNTDPNPRIAQAIQQDLSKIGVTLQLKNLAQANVIDAGGSGKAPMIWSGGMAWIADFPDPSNFYGAILGCSGASEGGWNWSKYCNSSLDAEAVKANEFKNPSDPKRLQMWSDIFENESHRVCRRLIILRELANEQKNNIFPRSPRTSRSHGFDLRA